MKVAVTGHSAGLGKAIADRFASDGHEIVGFSLDNGYDITDKEDFRRIVFGALDCDVFINCAHDREHQNIDQVFLLTMMFHHWKDQPKHIVSIGSIAPDVYWTDFDASSAKYRAAKAALDAATLEINSFNKPCRASVVRPDWIESRSSAKFQERTGDVLNTLDAADVVEIVAMVVYRGPEITFSSITMKRTAPAPEPRPEQPDKPKKKRWGLRK